MIMKVTINPLNEFITSTVPITQLIVHLILTTINKKYIPPNVEPAFSLQISVVFTKNG